MESKSFRTVLWNIVKNSIRTRVSAHTQYNYRAALKLYLQFVNSEEGLSKQINPDDLILEAQQNIEEAQAKNDIWMMFAVHDEMKKIESSRKMKELGYGEASLRKATGGRQQFMAGD